MATKTSNNALTRTAGILLLTLILVATTALAGWADDPIPEDVADYQSQDLTLEKKVLGGVVDTFGQRYDVNRTTMIIGTDGHQVTLSDLNVPCDVSLKSMPRGQGNPQAVRIKVRRYHPGANHQMSGNS